MNPQASELVPCPDVDGFALLTFSAIPHAEAETCRPQQHTTRSAAADTTAGGFAEVNRETDFCINDYTVVGGGEEQPWIWSSGCCDAASSEDACWVIEGSAIELNLHGHLHALSLPNIIALQRSYAHAFSHPDNQKSFLDAKSYCFPDAIKYMQTIEPICRKIQGQVLLQHGLIEESTNSTIHKALVQVNKALQKHFRESLEVRALAKELLQLTHQDGLQYWKAKAHPASVHLPN